MDETQRADPDARRTALTIVGWGAVAGVVVLGIAERLRPEFEAWLEQASSARLTIVSAGVTILVAGPLLGLAAYLLHLGQRIVSAERYPPPGLRRIRDTRVLTGPAASRRGRLIQLLAIVLDMAALLLAFLLWRLMTMLGTGAA